MVRGKSKLNLGFRGQTGREIGCDIHHPLRERDDIVKRVFRGVNFGIKRDQDLLGQCSHLGESP